MTVQEANHKILLFLLGAALSLLGAFAARQNWAQQTGRAIGLAALLVGWATVMGLVLVGVLTLSEGLQETIWICVGAVLGTVLPGHKPCPAEASEGQETE